MVGTRYVQLITGPMAAYYAHYAQHNYYVIMLCYYVVLSTSGTVL